MATGTPSPSSRRPTRAAPSPASTSPRRRFPGSSPCACPRRSPRSRTPRSASETAQADGMKEVRFRQTRPLPSYLVAFGVGPFEIKEARPAGQEAGAGAHRRPARARSRGGLGGTGDAGDPRGSRGLLRHRLPLREARRAGHSLHRPVRGDGERGAGHLPRDPGAHPARAGPRRAAARVRRRSRRTSSRTSGSETW